MRAAPLSSAGLMLMLVSTLLMSGCGLGARVKPISAEPLPAYPGNGDPPLLVDASWLLSRLDAGGDVRILDFADLRTYRREHINGAIHAWWQDAMDPYYETYGAVLKPGDDPNANRLTDLLADWGIGAETTVVAYDNTQNRHAAKIVWVLRTLGITRSAVLDGGLATWKGFDGATSDEDAEAPEVEPAPIVAQERMIIGTIELSQRLAAGDPSMTIVDGRTPEEAEDDLDDHLRHGTIPGALKLPWDQVVKDEAGRLQPPEELRRLFTEAGIAPEQEIVVFNRFGVETGPLWLALTVAGFPNVRVYDQGWAEWAQTDRPELPVAS